MYVLVGIVIGGIVVWLLLSRKAQAAPRSGSGDMIDVTEAGGAYLGPSHDTVRTINKRTIKELTDPGSQEIGTTVIVLNDGKRLYVTETKEEVRRRMA